MYLVLRNSTRRKRYYVGCLASTTCNAKLLNQSTFGHAAPPLYLFFERMQKREVKEIVNRTLNFINLSAFNNSFDGGLATRVDLITDEIGVLVLDGPFSYFH